MPLWHVYPGDPEAASIAVALGDDRLAAFVEHNLGDVAIDAGDHGQAVAHYQEALTRFRQVHDRRDVALALCSLGRAVFAAGDPREGLGRYGRASLWCRNRR